MSNIESQVEALQQGCEGVYTSQELKQRLSRGKRLRVKLGMDPTAPDLHLGHSVVLRKLRQFQDFGHKAVLIIGDYTALVGDPTGRSKTRPVLSKEGIDANAQTYLDQAGKILDLSQDKLEVRHNSEWLLPLKLADILKLMSQMTVARMLERDTFAKRQAEGKEIHLHELLYPLMQAQDSVEIRADVELGGTEQTFNNLCGRDLQRNAGQEPQIVMVLPILVGIDGTQKMSKSLGNYIGISDSPTDMFGKVMRIPDPLMKNYFTLLTEVSPAEIDELVDASKCNPRDTKEHLAKNIIARYHSAKEADRAAEEFRRVHAGGGSRGLPDDIPKVQLTTDVVQNGKAVPIELLIFCQFESSRNNARRIIAERGVRLNGEVIDDPNTPMAVQTGDILQRGKRRFVQLVIP